MITICPYDAAWPLAFTDEAARLRQALGELALRIEHVGSTSVPGLAAKPVIDIQVSVPDLGEATALAQRLATLGYVHVPLGDFDRVYPFFQRPAGWPASHHVHLCAAGGEQERKHLAFRDYLRDHPEVANRYLNLKRQLARRHAGDTQASRERYSLDKSDFVQEVLAAAFQAGYPLGGTRGGPGRTT